MVKVRQVQFYDSNLKCFRLIWRFLENLRVNVIDVF